MSSDLLVPIVLLIVLLIFGIFFFISVGKNSDKKSKKTNSGAKEKASNSNAQSTSTKVEVPKEDVFKFMEFDRILDDMIVQNKGQKYSMVIKCKGINYDLMSENEQLAVEEGFITFLNTLRFPIQLYVQAQNIDLKKTISKYNENLQGLVSEYDQVNQEYNQVINSLDSTKEEIRNADYNKKSVQNVLEYANDIVRYVERLSANKSLLQRSFYIIFSYHTSEITSISNFSKDEIVNICYNELYTRAASILSALSSCSVNGEVLTSNGLANLLYTSYNRDDAKFIDVQRALESGYYRLYSTSEDAFKKREAILEEQINNEAQIKAYEAIKKAIENGEYQTPEMQQIELNQEISKAAIEIVRSENIDENVKENAKDIIVEDYKKTKKKILDEESKKVAAKKSESKVEEKENKVEEKKEEKVEEKKIEKIKEEVKEEIKPQVKEEVKEEVAEEKVVTAPKAEEKKEEIVKNEDTDIFGDEIITGSAKEDKAEKPKNENNESSNNTANNTSSSSGNDDFEDDFFDSII